MPKALKWGILIASCMLLLCVLRIFRNQIGSFLGYLIYPIATRQEVGDAILESTETVQPWEAEIHSADADENKGTK